MSPSRRKKKGFFRKNIKAIVLVLIIAAGAAYYVLEADHQEAVESGVHKVDSPYSILENKDSVVCLANILLNHNRSILQISKDFYKSEAFWPYIFQENADLGNEENILNLNTGTILRIPRILPSLLDTSNVNNMKHVKYLADSLMFDIAEKRKEALETQNFSEW